MSFRPQWEEQDCLDYNSIAHIMFSHFIQSLALGAGLALALPADLSFTYSPPVKRGYVAFGDSYAAGMGTGTDAGGG